MNGIRVGCRRVFLPEHGDDHDVHGAVLRGGQHVLQGSADQQGAPLAESGECTCCPGLGQPP